MSRPVIGITAHTTAEGAAKAYAVRATYVKAVQAHGGLAVALPPGDTGTVDAYLELLDGLLIPGGTDVDPRLYDEEPDASTLRLDPELDRTELDLIRKAYQRDLPVLAICRGIQSVAVALGGALIQDLPSLAGKLRHEVREFGRDYRAHDITIEPGSRLRELIGTNRLGVNSLHHQAVDILPGELVGTAWSDDGILEGAEAANKRFFIALQCHPEELWNTTVPELTRLFKAFVDACSEVREERNPVSRD